MSWVSGQIRFASSIAAVVLLVAETALAGDRIVGHARVIDGEAIEIHGQRVKLAGLIGFEPDQFCLDAWGKRYSCGQRATQALAALIGGDRLTCLPIHESLERMAVCWLGTTDVGARLVREGWAVNDGAVEPDYSTQEATAKWAKAGAWAGEFRRPRPRRWLANR